MLGLTLLAACADLETSPTGPTSLDALGDETSVPELAAQRSELSVGELAFPTSTSLAINRTTPAHAFAFTLTAPARVSVRTGAASSGLPVDTVLTLLRRGDESVRKLVTRSDDFGGTQFSSITRDLGAGTYEVWARGFSRRATGYFELDASCEGEGCARVTSCIFGEQFSDLQSSSTIRIELEEWLRTETQVPSELEQRQLVTAVHQSSHEDVTTAAEALSRVDQNEVRRMRIVHTPSGERFDVYEYGAGDNSYGAIFEGGTSVVVASIHDGDLLSCTREQSAQ